jgi:hypothetical protein
VPGPSPAAAAPPATGMPASGQGSLARSSGGDDGDDEFVAALLIRMWALASGRTLRSDVRPDQLSSEELIRFWADDLTSTAGRHAGPAAGPARAAR